MRPNNSSLEDADPTPEFARLETPAVAASLYNDMDGKVVAHNAAHWSVRGNRLAAAVTAAYLKRHAFDRRLHAAR